MSHSCRNIFHCCTIKSASQWFRALFADRLIRRRTGLSPCHWKDDLGIRPPLVGSAFTRPFPDKTTAVSLYVTYATYQAIPKPGPHKTFFVLRDPRDLAVSWYYSLRNSHAVLGEHMARHRDHLRQASREDGLVYAIDRMASPGQAFDALRSWSAQDEPPERVSVRRYEDLFGPDAAGAFAGLMAFLEIELTPKEQARLLKAFAFSRFSGGRRPGTVDDRHHYRSGVAGGWKQEFTDPVKRHFAERTGDLAAGLGFEPTR